MPRDIKKPYGRQSGDNFLTSKILHLSSDSPSISIPIISPPSCLYLSPLYEHPNIFLMSIYTITSQKGMISLYVPFPMLLLRPQRKLSHAHYLGILCIIP